MAKYVNCLRKKIDHQKKKKKIKRNPLDPSKTKQKKLPKKEKKKKYGISATICIDQEIQCLPYAGLFMNAIEYNVKNSPPTIRQDSKVHWLRTFKMSKDIKIASVVQSYGNFAE